MSEQPPPYPPPGPGGPGVPPYPQQPSAQPYPQAHPQAPYAPPTYPGSPYGGQPPKSHTTRNVLLIVGVVIVLVCGGLVGVIALGVTKAKTAIDSYDNYPGGPNQPITTTIGQGFEIHGMQYSDGWKVNPAADYVEVITGLTATNNRPNKSSRSVDVDVKFLKGTTILAEVSCDSGATDIGFGQSKLLKCSSGDAIPRTYDSITVNDAYGDFDY